MHRFILAAAALACAVLLTATHAAAALHVFGPLADCLRRALGA